MAEEKQKIEAEKKVRIQALENKKKEAMIELEVAR